MRNSSRDVFTRALNSTLSFWGGWQKVLFAVVLCAAGFAALALRLDGVRFEDELATLALYTFAPLTLFVMLQFIWNLVSSPYRLERDAHDTSLAQLQMMTIEMATLAQRLADQNPIRIDPATGATVVGKAGGPVTIMGGHFTRGIRIGG